jgi:hypothetical protein
VGELLDTIGPYDDIIVFGRGTMGQTFFNVLKGLGTSKPVRFCDSNAKPNAPPGADLLTPDEAVERYPNALFCIGSVTHHKTMFARLVQLGVSLDNILSTPESIINEDRRRKLVPRMKLGGVYYHIAEHCNLKCSGCLHFSNIAEEEFADLQTFQRDISRLNEMLEGGLTSFNICGGEPLLHPQIEDFIESARRLLPAAGISVLTNGLLLPDMPESFWETMKHNKIGISMTKYPAAQGKHGEIAEKAERYGINMYTSVNPDNWNKHIFDLTGGMDSSESFMVCPRANGTCPCLHKGKLYPCPISAYAGHFNRRFGQNLTYASDDGIDIYSDITGQDIFNFLAKPIPFCRYCDMQKLAVSPWRMSKQEISEYL